MNDRAMDTALAVCRLLGDAANHRPHDLSLLQDEAELLGFAKIHHMIPLVSSALRAGDAPKEPYQTLHRAAESAAFHQTKNTLLTADVLSRLEAANIQVLPLKGGALQAVYPDGWIRPSTDTDLLVSSAQATDAAAVLTALGFEQTHAHGDDLCFQKPPRAVIELHTSLGGFTKQQRKALDRLAHTPFTVHEHYVYTLFHLYKHFLYAGAGVRMFWDMYCLSRAVTDRDTIATWLTELGLREFDSAVQAVNKVLFDGHDATDAEKEVIELVFCCGAFGTDDTYRALRSTARTGRFRRRILDYGLDRAAMKERYPILKRHILLYPVCVLRRVTHGLLFKRKVLRHTLRSDHTVDRRQIERVLNTMHIL